MTSASYAGKRAEEGARKATDNRWVKLVGRVGIASYGVVNLLIAYLAIKVAMGHRNESADKFGAVGTVASQPAGRFLLWVITIGLFALTLWQIGEAIWGFHYTQDTKQRSRRRISAAGEAILFGTLTYTAGRAAIGAGASKTGKQKSLTADVLSWPGGQLIIGLIGVGVVAIALFVIHRGLSKRFTEDLDFSGANEKTRQAAIRTGQVGYAGLGAAYVVLGVLVVAAAVTYDPNKAGGLDAALKTLAGQSWGLVLLWVIALGLICFGVYCFFDARLHRS